MSSSASVDLDSDQIFEILSSQRRRMVLYFLRRNGRSATMDDLAEQIAAWENDIPIDELTSQQRKRVYVSLYQTHLPKLADTNLIDYDVDEGDIQLTDRATEMDAFLTPEGSSDFSWRRHYLGLVLLGGALMLMAVLMVPILGEASVVLMSSTFLAGYLVMIGFEYWSYQKRESEVPSELVPQDR